MEPQSPDQPQRELQTGYGPMPEPRKSRAPWVIAGIIALVAVVGIVVAIVANGGDPNARLIKGCEDTVTQTLKAPSTAKFSGASIVDADTGVVGEKTVTGFVDAENGFSAMIRSSFTCDLVPDGNGGYTVTGSVDDGQQ